MLSVKGVKCSYGRVEVLHGVDLEVRQGEIVTLVGANGAGKTTLMRAISGVMPLTAGSVSLQGQVLDGLPAHRRLRLGMAHVPEGRQIFGPLSVEHNLRLGAWIRRRSADVAEDLESVYDTFPALKDKRRQQAGLLSGGQQQMLAIGRALMSRPRLLLLDEPSMGLAPVLVEQVMAVIRSLKQRGLTILLVEQNVSTALAMADRGYVLETGQIAISGEAPALLKDPRVSASYLGAGAA